MIILIQSRGKQNNILAYMTGFKISKKTPELDTHQLENVSNIILTEHSLGEASFLSDYYGTEIIKNKIPFPIFLPNFIQININSMGYKR